MVHQSPVPMTLFLKPEVIGNEGDKGKIEQHVKALMGRDDVEVLNIRKIPGPDGKTRGFEVDIR
jgi:hypothetical protein